MKSKSHFDVVIVGGGLAGLTCAIHLSKYNRNVLLFEKVKYPKHKVCGEYVSNEVLPYLNSLGIFPKNQGAKEINTFEITTSKNKTISSKLELGGFGISRYCLDNLLANKAIENGVEIKYEQVNEINFTDTIFSVQLNSKENFTSNFVIGAFGKRSNLDKSLKRKFIDKQSPFLAVKTHVNGDFPNNKVALHNFEGGYCGVSKVENNHINLCYIASYKSFKKHKNIQDFQENVVFKNHKLKAIFKESIPVFDKPLTISQISFDKKPLIQNHILMCGDASAMIHPLCGNGMGMAISSAQLLSTLLVDYFENKIKSRDALEKMYLSKWKKRFDKRLFFGHILASIFENKFATRIVWFIVYLFPVLIPKIIKNTHGKPLSRI